MMELTASLEKVAERLSSSKDFSAVFFGHWLLVGSTLASGGLPPYKVAVQAAVDCTVYVARALTPNKGIRETARRIGASPRTVTTAQPITLDEILAYVAAAKDGFDGLFFARWLLEGVRLASIGLPTSTAVRQAAGDCVIAVAAARGTTQRRIATLTGLSDAAVKKRLADLHARTD
jgi:hypothetical protein